MRATACNGFDHVSYTLANTIKCALLIHGTMKAQNACMPTVHAYRHKTLTDSKAHEFTLMTSSLKRMRKQVQRKNVALLSYWVDMMAFFAVHYRKKN